MWPESLQPWILSICFSSSLIFSELVFCLQSALMFRLVLKINNYYFSKYHNILCSEDAMCFCGIRNWISKQWLDYEVQSLLGYIAV
jgi:hypothetical protein